MKTYHHLNPEERAVIMLMLDNQDSLRQIALKLERSPSIISRELKRNKVSSNTYMPSHAGNSYRQRRLSCVKPRKLQEGN